MKKFKGISGRSITGIVLPIFLVSALIIAGFPGQISFPNTSGERAGNDQRPDISTNKDENYAGNTGNEAWYYYTSGVVNAANGNLFMATKDISFQARGFRLEVIRSYNSHNADYRTAFGNGWTHNYNIYLKEKADASVLLIEGDGSIHNFTSTGGGNYSSPPGIHSQLKKPGTTYALRTKDGTKYNFNATGALTDIVDKNGNNLTLSYTDEKLSTVYDDSGLSITFNYDINDRVSSIIGPLSCQYTYQYDGSGNLINVTDPTGNFTLYQYKSGNILKNVIDKKARVLNFTYSSASLPKVMTIGNSHYNRTDGYIINPYIVYTFSYNAVSRTLIETKRGSNYTIAMNAEWNPSEITNPLGYKDKTTWSSDMNLISVEDAKGNSWSYTYDQMGNMLNKTSPLGEATRHCWTNIDNSSTYISLLMNITDPSSNTTHFDYDTEYNFNLSVDAKGHVQKYFYDAYGHLTTYVNQRGLETIYAYDTHGYLMNVTDAVDNRTHYQHDGVGRLTRVTDRNSHVTEYEYDDLDRVILLRDARNNVTRYFYDELGNLVRVIDGNNGITDRSVNYINKPENVTNPSGNTTSFRYDKFGNLIQFTDESDVQTEFEFDKLDRIISVTDTYSNKETYSYDEVGNLVRFVDKRGYATDYEYDGLNRLNKITNALGGTINYEYDWASNLINLTDPRDLTTRFEYDEVRQLIRIIDASGNATQIDYDKEGNIINITNARGYTNSYEYDSLNRLITINDPLGNTTRYEYDAEGNLIAMINARNYTTTLDYDELNRLVRITDALGNSTEYAYDSVGNVLSVRNRLDGFTNFTYDELYRIIKVANAYGNETRYSYDENGNLMSVFDARGYETQYQYDALNRLILITDPMGNQIQYSYDAVGNLIAATDPNWFTTSYSYDALNRLVLVTDAMGNNITYSYDALGNFVNYTNRNGYSMQFAYDEMCRFMQITDALGAVINYSYDAVGNLLSYQYKGDATRNYEYDGMNRLVKSIDGLGYWDEYRYDSVGNVIEIVNRNGNSTIYEYDSLNRLIKEIDALDYHTKYRYDAEGNLIQIEDPMGVTINYTFDLLSRVTSIENAGYSTTFSYDGNGNVINRTDRQGVITTYSYDALNRLVEVEYPDSSRSIYQYDAKSNLLQTRREGAGLSETMDYNYDPLGRLLDLTVNYGSFVKSISYSYDAEGNIISMNDPQGGMTNYEYDPINRLTRIEDPSLRVIDISYDAIGRRSRIDYPNGAYNTYSYDNASRLLNLTLWNISSSVLAFYEYSYDKVGYKIEIHSSDGDILYTYDKVHRLTDVNAIYSDMSTKLTNFTYDPSGNRLTKTVNGNTTSYTYNNNRLTSEVSNRTINYYYDPNGNLIMKQDPLFGTTDYQYDFENMLISATLPDTTTIWYDYSAMGTRLRRNNATAQTYYFYDHEDILMEFDSGGNLVARNTHSNIIDEPLTREVGGVLYCYHTDKSLSIRSVTDPSCNVSATYLYSAFGEIENKTGSFDSNYSFTGREKDVETNLYFYRSRYYDAEIGRFISEDSAGAIAGTNFYTYVGNNPVNFVDPLGRGSRFEPGLKRRIKKIENHIEMKKQEAKKLTDQAKECYQKAKDELEAAENVPGSWITGVSGAVAAVDAGFAVADAIGTAVAGFGCTTGAAAGLFAASTPVAAFVAPIAAAVGLVAGLINIDVQNHLQAASGAAATGDGLMAHAQHYINDIKNELKELEWRRHQLSVEEYFEKLYNRGFDGDPDIPPPPPPGPRPEPGPPVPTGGGGGPGGGPRPRGRPQPTPTPTHTPTPTTTPTPTPTPTHTPTPTTTPTPTPTPTTTPTPTPSQGETPTPHGSTPIPEPDEPNDFRPMDGFYPYEPKEPPEPDDSGLIMPWGDSYTVSEYPRGEEKKNTELPTPFSFPWKPIGVNTGISRAEYALSSFAPFARTNRVFPPELTSQILQGTSLSPPLYFLPWNDTGITDSSIDENDIIHQGNNDYTTTITNDGDYITTSYIDMTLGRYDYYESMNEGFESGIFPPSDWYVHNLGHDPTGFTWEESGFNPHKGSFSAGVYPGGPTEYQDEWLITAPSDLTTMDGPMLQFWFDTPPNPANIIEVWASPHGGTEPGEFTDILYTINPMDDPHNGYDSPVEIDLEEYSDCKEISFAFQYTGTAGTEFYLDDVVVSGNAYQLEKYEERGPLELDPGQSTIETFNHDFEQGSYRITYELQYGEKYGGTDDNPDNDVLVRHFTAADLPPRRPTNIDAELTGGNFENVTVNWILSEDDSKGENDVTSYDIYYNQTYSVSRTGYTLLASVGPGNTSFVHVNDGFNASNSFYYVVVADATGYTNSTVDQAGKFVRELSSGKQLVSIPLVQFDTTLTTVLQTIDGNYDHVQWYDPLDTIDHWLSYSTFKPASFNNLQNVDHMIAMWINMTAPDNLTVAGRVPLQTSIQLYEGWNFVSYASFTDRSVSEALAGIPYEQVEGFDESAPTYYLKTLSDPDIMSAGRGYWIRVASDCVWTIKN